METPPYSVVPCAGMGGEGCSKRLEAYRAGGAGFGVADEALEMLGKADRIELQVAQGVLLVCGDFEMLQDNSKQTCPDKCPH